MPSDADLPSASKVTITSGQWRLAADYIRPADEHSLIGAAILLNKANGNREAYASLATELAERGIASLRVDLRGHGESVNAGRFIPFDTAGRSISLDDTPDDIEAARRWLARQPGIDRTGIAVVGASYSAEAMAEAGRRYGAALAYVALSPGNISDTSLAAIDASGIPWLIVVSRREQFVRRQRFVARLEAASHRARLIQVPDSAHATDLLAASPLLEGRIADWIAMVLGEARRDQSMLTAARGVGAGLLASHVRSASSARWPDDALRPGEQTLDLSSGVSGQVLFFADLHRVTRDTGDLRAVREGADILLQALSGPDSAALLGETTLYRGIAGVAVALAAAHRETGVAAYFDAYRAVVNRMSDAGTAAPGAPHWSDAADVMFGDAGTGLFMLAAGRSLDDSIAVRRAAGVAHTLVSRGVADRGGLTWKRLPTSPFILPNFSHGASGIGLFLSMAGEATNDSSLRVSATLAARHLLAVARRDSLGFRVPYGWPDPDGGWARPFDIGWAHGPAGTARLFWQLWMTTRNRDYLSVVEECALAIRHAGLFGTPRPEYGRAPFGLSARFELAGVADFLADLYDVTGDRRHLRLARAIADTIIARAEHVGTGLQWTVPRYAFMTDAGKPAVLTGYSHGAAGYGLLFLKLDALERGRALPTRLPDSPFD